jgi:hypothetical protein
MITIRRFLAAQAELIKACALGGAIGAGLAMIYVQRTGGF